MRNVNDKIAFSIAVIFSAALLFASFAAAADTVCTYTLTPKAKSLSAKAGSSLVKVKTKTGCAWTASSSETWLTITSGESGSGNGSVRYSATANTVTSPRTAMITIEDKTFTVTQAAGSPKISVTPAAISLGSIEIGASSGGKEIKAKNTGTADLSISAVGISGTNESEFSIESNTCTSELAAGATCEVTIVFTPESKGAKNASLVISSDDPARPSLSAKLKGSGKAPVDRSAKYAKDIFILYKNARLGTISDEDFLDQLSAVLSAIDSAPGGPQYFEAYLNNRVLGNKFNSSVSGAKVSRSSTWDDIKNSETWLVITTFVSTVTDALVTEFVPGGDALSVAMQPELARGILLINYEAQIRNICYSNPNFLYECTEAKNKVSTDPAGALVELCEATGTPLPSNICTYSISSTGTQVEATEGGPWSITVTAPDGCNWSAASNTTWINVTDVSSDGILSTSGPGFVAFTVDANIKSSERAGSIFIAGKTFAVTQKGTESEDDTSPFSGSLSGNWSGSCTIEGYTGDASGTFQLTISPSGAVTGSYGGDDSGSISGSVKTGGSFTAAGSAGGVSWSGNFSVSGTAMSGSGSWKGGGCSGGWSGTGSADN